MPKSDNALSLTPRASTIYDSKEPLESLVSTLIFRVASFRVVVQAELTSCRSRIRRRWFPKTARGRWQMIQIKQYVLLAHENHREFKNPGALFAVK